jgi:leucyl aminopeptidase
MALTGVTAEVDVAVGPLSDVDTEVLAVPVFEDDTLEALAPLDAATGGEVGRLRASGEFRSELYELSFVPVLSGAWRAARVVLAGAGPRRLVSTERLRKLAAAVGMTARRRRVARLAFCLCGELPQQEAAQAAIEGLTLGEFDPGVYKSESRLGPPPALAVVHEYGDRGVLAAAVARGRVLGESSNLARALANEPSNLLTPRVLADRAAALVADTRLGVEILGPAEIEALGMGLLLGVARGSEEPPRLIVLRHEPAGADGRPVLGLVGKGITFDTGGISLKPATGMERMKDDMAGGAAVICAMRALSLLDAPIRVVGVVPSAENMPGSRAIKPGDVLRSASGKTVEVVNTDAEGRLVLGDALWYARQRGVTHLVDVATLTGACVVALGKLRSGLFGTPDPWVAHVRQVAGRAGDRAWPMPVDDEYFEQMKSEVADFCNSGGRPAGAITAAMFVKQFAGDLPWVHMDVAGTAWLDEQQPYQPKGATGVAVRTLAELPFTFRDWR